MRRIFLVKSHPHCFLSLLLFLIILLLSTSSCLGIAANDTVGYRGTFWSETNGSVGTLYYDFSPYGFQPDSVRVSVGDTEIIVFRHITDSTSVGSVQTWQVRKGHLLLKGMVSFDILSGSKAPFGAHVTGFYQDAADSTRTVTGWANLYGDWSYQSIGMSWLLPFSGFFRSTFDGKLNDEGVFIGAGASIGEVKPHWAYNASTSWSGLGKNFAFSEPFRTECRWFTRTHGDFIPELTAGGGLTKIKVRHDDYEFRQVKWGADIGAALKVPFHRVSYRYSTAAGGYHTAELYIAMSEDLRSGMGTTYQFRYHDKVWTATIMLNLDFVEGLAFEPPGSASGQINRRDRRPWPLKILGYAAFVPLYPLSLLEDW